MRTKAIRLAAPLLLIALVAVAVVAFQWILRDRTTVTSLSPDDRVRARLVERPGWIDRNFDVILERLDDGTKTVVFSSPDEGRPEGSERFLWSRDGTMLLLVGRHFIVRPPSMALETGETVYLLYHLPSRRTWCNSEQQARFPPIPNDLSSRVDFGVGINPGKSIAEPGNARGDGS